MTEMHAINRLVRDYWRLMTGQPLVGSRRGRPAAERNARASVERFSRGNVAVQQNRFVTHDDLERERDQVADLNFRN